MYWVNRGHIGDSINSGVLSFVERLPFSQNVLVLELSIIWDLKNYAHAGIDTVAQYSYYTFDMLGSNPPGQLRVVPPSWTSHHLHHPPPGRETMAGARPSQPPQDGFS